MNIQLTPDRSDAGIQSKLTMHSPVTVKITSQQVLQVYSVTDTAEHSPDAIKCTITCFVFKGATFEVPLLYTVCSKV